MKGIKGISENLEPPERKAGKDCIQVSTCLSIEVEIFEMTNDSLVLAFLRFPPCLRGKYCRRYGSCIFPEMEVFLCVPLRWLFMINSAALCVKAFIVLYRNTTGFRVLARNDITWLIKIRGPAP